MPITQNGRRWASAAAGALILGSLWGCAGPAAPEPDSPPLILADNIFDPGQPETLGLKRAPGAQTYTVYRPGDDDHRYNHGAVVMAFQGKLYAQWQSSAKDEDAPETEVRYAVSEDQGATWSKAQTLVPARKGAVVTNGGWWTDGQTLISYINVWPSSLEPRGGYVEFIRSDNGRDWSAPERVLAMGGRPLAGVIEQDLRALPSGRLLTAVHVQPGLVAKPYYTDDPLGLSGWTRGELDNLPHKPEMSRELEPSWYQRPDGSVVMTFRDQAGSFRILASESHDQGLTWSNPVETNFIDSRAKQSAGNLPGGAAFIVNNPSGSKTRIPLTLTLSEDGRHFDRAYWIRAGGGDLQPRRYEGKYKRDGYSYPKSYVGEHYLYVAYATNKEDIEVTRIPLSALSP